MGTAQLKVTGLSPLNVAPFQSPSPTQSLSSAFEAEGETAGSSLALPPSSLHRSFPMDQG